MAVKKYRPSTFQKTATTEYNALVALVNELKTRQAEDRALANQTKAKLNATLTKLDADAGVTDTNYSALNAVATADVSAVAASDANTLAKTF